MGGMGKGRKKHGKRLFSYPSSRPYMPSVHVAGAAARKKLKKKADVKS
jgi:hypothetical protein